MKIIAFIMAFLVLALSLMPCADTDNAGNDSNAKTLVSKSNQQRDNPQQDDCSPFCQCSCCAGFCINHSNAPIVIADPGESKTQIAFLPAGILDIALPVWQPPQLV